MQFSHITLLVLFLSACTFTSDEEYFENIDPPDPAGITMELSDHNGRDTIHIYETTKFRYRIDANGGRVKSVSVTAAGILYESGQSPSGEFTIYQTSPSRTYEVLLEFTSTSGTGSIADVLGAEGFIGSRKWIVAAHFQRPPAPVVDLKIVDGMLRVSWPAYTKSNFKRYRVYRYNGNNTYGTEITDPKQNFWFDDGYTGGPLLVRYVVTVENSIGSISGERNYSHPLNVRFTLNKNDTTVTMQWDKNPFYGAFKEYVIKTLPNVTEVITQIEDTVKTFKLNDLYFGGHKTVSFEADANQNDILFNNVQQIVALGDSLPEATAIYYSNELNSFVLKQVSPKKPLILNDNLEVTAGWTLNHPISILPYPGRYYFDFASDRINMVDLVTQEVKTRITGTSLTGRDGAGNGTILIRSYTRNFGKFYYYSGIEDMFNQKLLYLEGSSSTVFDVGALPVNLADDGKHFVAMTDKKVYKVIPGDTSVLVGDLPEGKFIGFRTDDSNEIIFDNGSTIVIYDANTLAYLRSVGPPEGGFSYSAYDHQSKYMLWKKSNTNDAYLVHIETNSYKRTKIASSAILLKGHLFIPASGLYIKVL